MLVLAALVGVACARAAGGQLDSVVFRSPLQGDVTFSRSASRGIAVWVVQSDPARHLTETVVGRFVDSDGRPVGQVFAISPRLHSTVPGYTPNIEDRPSVVVGPHGGFVVVWAQALINPGPNASEIGGQVLAREVNAAEGPVGHPILVAAAARVRPGYGVPVTNLHPAIACDPAGGCEVTWVVAPLSNDGNHNILPIRCRWINPVTGRQAIARTLTTVHSGLNTSVAFNRSARRYLVLWNGSPSTLLGLTVSAAGIPSNTPPITVFTGHPYPQPGGPWVQSIAQDHTGFLGIWLAATRTTGVHLVLAHLTPFGQPVGKPTILLADADPSAAALITDPADGRTGILAWTADGHLHNAILLADGRLASASTLGRTDNDASNGPFAITLTAPGHYLELLTGDPPGMADSTYAITLTIPDPQTQTHPIP